MRRTGGRGIAMGVAALFVVAACSKGNSGNSGGGSAGTSSGAMMPTTGTSTGAMGGTSAGAAPSATTDSLPQMSDTNMISVIGVIDGTEIAAGQMAERMGKSSAVKDYGKLMVTDHRAIQKSVDSLAKAEKITPKAGPMADSLARAAKAEADSMKKLKGAAFDTAYAAAMVNGHQQALNTLNSMSAMTQDAGLKAVIQAAIPKIQTHLDKAKQLQSGGTT